MPAFSLGKLPLSWRLSWDSLSQTNSLIAGTVASFLLLLMTNKRVYLRILFPGVVPDSKYKKTHPLPPGEITGCPYFGSTEMFPDMNGGLHEYAHKISSLSPVRIFKSYFLFGPMAVISGTSRARKLLNTEFSPDGVSQPVNSVGNMLEIIGKTSLSTETKDKAKYRYLRSLVGHAMTHEAVAKSIPALQLASESVIEEKILAVAKDEGLVKITERMKYMTLDVAWRQILGLDLKSKEEIEEFHRNVATWLEILTSSNLVLYSMLPMPLLRMTSIYKAKLYLTHKIMEKITALEEKGCPDGSTVGAMLFAEDAKADENGTTKRLTKEQVIDNALLLIAAGSETSASTLTNAILLLGLNPDKYQKLVKEQNTLMKSKGEDLTKDMLDHECPYLESVVKEVMRMLPVSGGPFRVSNSTITLDGFQIPKNWWVLPSIYLTHEYDPVSWLDDGSHMDLKKGFKPERWLDEKTHPKDYMPWGVSYRFCAGHILAMAEMKTFLAIFCRKVKGFDLVNEVDDMKDIKWMFGAIATPKDHVPITIRN
jgi:cytochrome P450